jgi:hypothetical protein
MALPSNRGLLAASAALLLLLSPARAAEPAGELWQTTSQMVMAGMPFSPPPQTHKVCRAAEWTQPPPGGDSSCVTSNFQRTGDEATWRMQCSGDRPMSGTGQITFAADVSYTGVINAMSEGMSMKINLSGRKIGTCDDPVD